MARILIPGRVDRHGIAHPLPSCRGNCNQGRTACECELSNATPPDANRTFGGKLRRGQIVAIVPAMTGGPTPLRTRLRHFAEDFWAFICASRFRP